jgi:hypothetical protein
MESVQWYSSPITGTPLKFRVPVHHVQYSNYSFPLNLREQVLCWSRLERELRINRGTWHLAPGAGDGHSYITSYIIVLYQVSGTSTYGQQACEQL